MTGMVVNQYGAEFPSKLTEPLHGWQVNFTNDKISNLMLEEYGKPERRFCVIRFKCTGPPESRETTSSPRGTAAMGVDGQADDLPLAKLCQQPGDVVGMEFRLAIPKGSTRPDKVNAWLWPMIVSFLMSAPWQVVSDEVSRGSLDQWARGSSSRPRGATLKEVPYSARPEWTLQRQAGTLAFNYRNAQARPPSVLGFYQQCKEEADHLIRGPSKRPVQQPREQAHAEPQPQQQEKASGVPVNRPRAEDSLEALMAELERTKSGFVAAALRRQETDEKLKAAQREHNQTAKEAKEWATRFSAAQAALASYDDERARSKKQG